MSPQTTAPKKAQNGTASANGVAEKPHASAGKKEKAAPAQGSSMHPTKNDLAEHVRFAMVELLNKELTLSIDLALQTKQAHWNVKGPQFLQLHEFFDSLRDIVDEFVDDIAERAVALGGTAEGTVQVVASKTSLPEYSLTTVAGKDHLQALANAFAQFGKSAREAIDLSDEAGDADTADLFTGISRQTDKQLWFIESHLLG